MRNIPLYLWCKKIHRYLVLVTFVVSSVMIATGVMLHENEYVVLSPIVTRSLHNQMSVLCAVSFGIMSITGLYLFIFPYLPAKKEPPKQVN